MPVVDKVATDYQDDFEFLAIAWKSDPDKARQRAKELFSSNLRWGLDEDEDVFRAYGIPGQPASVIVVEGVIVDQWFGAVGEQELRERLDAALALT